MEITTKQKITQGSAITLAILAIILQVPDLIHSNNVYVCLDTKIALECDSLSKINDEGIQTRCYYTNSEEPEKNSYKICKTGWLKYEKPIEYPKNNSISEIKNPIYLVCEKTNDLISECQVIDENETIYKIQTN